MLFIRELYVINCSLVFLECSEMTDESQQRYKRLVDTVVEISISLYSSTINHSLLMLLFLERILLIRLEKQ